MQDSENRHSNIYSEAAITVENYDKKKIHLRLHLKVMGGKTMFNKYMYNQMCLEYIKKSLTCLQMIFLGGHFPVLKQHKLI